MADPDLPSFDLIVATVDRVDELERLLTSLERQSHGNFRVLLVDQNDDGRLHDVLARHAALDVQRLRSPRGLSRARNAALAEIRAELVAFPDDDCWYEPQLLETVAHRFATEPALDGLTGRAVDESGRSTAAWKSDGARLTRENLWNRAISFAIFLRAGVVHELGPFDEDLGLGAPTPWSSGEETEYLVRGIGAGARIEYDPSLVVAHAEKPLRPADGSAVGLREGASVGYILRKHRYPARTVARMLVRPLGGAAVSLARRDLPRMRFHLATLRGRLLGYRS